MKKQKEYGSAELFIAGSTCGKEKDGFPTGLVIVDAKTHKISRYYQHIGREGEASRGEQGDGERK